MCYTCRAVTKEALQLLGDASYGGAAPLSLEHEAKHRARSLDLIRAPSTPPLQVAVGSIIRSHKCRCTDVCRNACTSAHALYTHTHTHIHTPHTHANTSTLPLTIRNLQHLPSPHPLGSSGRSIPIPRAEATGLSLHKNLCANYCKEIHVLISACSLLLGTLTFTACCHLRVMGCLS